ncbi:MAG: Tfp pilus assembly protein PilN [Candidatus Saccharimonadales bacterium]|jgi:Tfp pilus assembly protein PilN
MINLIPHDLRSSRTYARRNRTLVGYIIALLLAALMVAATMLISLSFVGADEPNLKKTIEDNQIQVSQLESQTSDLSKVSSRLTTADKLFESSIEFSSLIPEIGSLLPEGAVLNSLSLTGGNTDPLGLDVGIANADLAAILQKNLVDSELFEAADIGSISSSGSSERYTFSALISVSFTGSAAEKAKIAAAAQAAAAARAEDAEKAAGTN